MHKHQITTEDRWILDKHPIDPVAKEPLKVGDTVVICASCKTVHYDTTWGIKPNKPCAMCDGNTLTDFNEILSEAFRRNGSDLLRIINTNDRPQSSSETGGASRRIPERKNPKTRERKSWSLNKYPFVILDYSVLFSLIDDDLYEELKNHTDVYVSKTFNAECEQIRTLMNGNSLRIFQKNKRIIKSITIKQLPDVTEASDDDAFALAKYFAENDVDILIITTNQIMIQNIVLENIQVDIYDASCNRIIGFNQFNSIKNTYEVSHSKNTISYSTKISANAELYTENGGTIRLGSEFNAKGTEAIIYRVNGDANLLAKIYREKKLTNEKIKNIQYLSSYDTCLDTPWCAFPKKLLFLDRTLRQPIGYTMAFVKDIKLLADEELFAGAVKDILPHHRETKISFTVDLCLKVVSQILYLQMNGIMVSDFNDGNFALSADNSKPVVMLDTDSFGYRDYFSDCRAQYDEYTRYFDFKNKIELIKFSHESLFIFSFKLFTLGLQPLYNNKFRFRADRKNRGNDFRWSFIPDNLRHFFISVFDEKKTRSINAFLFELQTVSHTLRRIKAKNKRYRELCTEFLDSTRADNLGGEFTCVIAQLSNRTPFAQTVNVRNGVATIMQSCELVYFKLNDDKTYSIAIKKDNEFLFLSAAANAGQNGTRISFSKPDSSYAQKWRIEKINNRKTTDGYEIIDCVIGSELYLNFIIDVNEKNELQLWERGETPDWNRQHYSLCKITEEDYCDKITLWPCPCGQNNEMQLNKCVKCKNEKLTIYKRDNFDQHGGEAKYFRWLNENPDKASEIFTQYAEVIAQKERERRERERLLREERERQEKRRKLIAAGVILGIFLIALIIALVVIFGNRGSDSANTASAGVYNSGVQEQSFHSAMSINEYSMDHMTFRNDLCNEVQVQQYYFTELDMVIERPEGESI